MAAGEGGGRGGPSVEFTPTWVAALVCTVIVLLSLVVQRIIHVHSKRLKKKNKRFLYKALKKVKEVLARLQDEIVNICIPIKWAVTGLPCKVKNSADSDTITTIAHFGISTRHHLLAETTHESHCQKFLECRLMIIFGKLKDRIDLSDARIVFVFPWGKVPLISYHALHDLHILIFVLAVVHVVVCALTVLFGAAKISQWRQWENSILKKISNVDQEGNIINVKNDDFIKNRFMGIHANKRIWLHSFAKHLYSSVSESDYAAMRMGFVQVHCRDNPTFNFYEYMMHAFEADFAKVVSISGYAWVIVIISMLLNIAGKIDYIIYTIQKDYPPSIICKFTTYYFSDVSFLTCRDDNSIRIRP
ncbi:MLO-like protein 15 [Amaranthus tricolor]|uniref:MLO-like protein 15 n=1 Tax=Amaranthus tricolor TaxID=29722 RepID=UPI00258B85EB|nr:MLO-like protein 15 [Amaranthus tricolor]